jgi:hypothetical protein
VAGLDPVVRVGVPALAVHEHVVLVTGEPYWPEPRGRSQTVIARVWTGRTKAEDYDIYLAYLEESGVAALHATRATRG